MALGLGSAHLGSRLELELGSSRIVLGLGAQCRLGVGFGSSRIGSGLDVQLGLRAWVSELGLSSYHGTERAQGPSRLGSGGRHEDGLGPRLCSA